MSRDMRTAEPSVDFSVLSRSIPPGADGATLFVVSMRRRVGKYAGTQLRPTTVGMEIIESLPRADAGIQVTISNPYTLCIYVDAEVMKTLQPAAQATMLGMPVAVVASLQALHWSYNQ